MNATAGVAGNTVRAPFPGNLVPPSRLHPVAVAVSKYHLAPDDPGLPNQRYAAGNFSLPQFSFPFLFSNWNSRADFKAGDNDRCFYRFSTNKHTQERTLNGILGKPGEQAYNPFLRQNHAYMLDWVRVLSPAVTPNLRGNYTRCVEGNDVNLLHSLQHEPARRQRQLRQLLAERCRGVFGEYA